MKINVLKSSAVKNNFKEIFQCYVYFINLFIILLNDKFKEFNSYNILYFRNKRNNGYFN